MDRNHPKMSNRDRAKQFMPFAALKGYENALKKSEKIKVKKPLLSEEDWKEMDRTLHELQCGDWVELIHHEGDEYLHISGIVVKRRLDEGYLCIGKQKIDLHEIFGLTRIKSVFEIERESF